MPALSLERWREVDDLLAQALDRPADERTAFLRHVCGQDPSLYAEVTALLDSDEESERVLGEFASSYAAPLLEDLGDALGSGLVDDLDPAPAQVGPYRIVREVGRGGMGTVYLAERADGAFEKRVAVKLVRRGMDTEEVLRRFRAERQILAVLDHPNVARLLDGGAASDGRPYFAMEFVEGEPITTYSDTRRLTVDQRLDLFDSVCEAVRHAHQHLVVHRDLKPGNVLVTTSAAGDGAPQVKLLDFGIARLLEAGADPELTGVGRVLTPAYASPEQRAGAPVTTASDVYQLGILLFEVLAGRRPDAATRPSAAVTAAAAEARGATEERLRARLRGDLDSIAAQALEEEPDRRYPSAEALLADIRRHSGGLPVTARPDSAAYRAGRFVRRHRAGVAGAALLVLVLAGASLALAVSAGTAAAERDRAREERDRAEATASLLEGLFTASDPMGAERLDTLRARDLLARGVRSADADLREQPLIRAQMLDVIGRAYTRIGLHATALPLMRRALSLRESGGAPAEDVSQTRHTLGQTLSVHGLHDEAERELRRALADRTELFGARHLLVAETQATLADVLQAVGDNEEAERLLRSALDTRRPLLGDRHEVVANTLTAIAGVLLEQGRLDEGERAYRDAIAHYAGVRQGSQGQYRALGGLGFLYLMSGRHAEAEAVLRESLTLMESRLGRDHWRVGLELTTLASTIRAQGRGEEAEALLRRALAIPPRRPQDRAIALGSLATTLRERGDLAGAEASQREAVAILEQAYGSTDPVTEASRSKLAGILREAGRGSEADRLAAPAVAAGHAGASR